MTTNHANILLEPLVKSQYHPRKDPFSGLFQQMLLACAQEAYPIDADEPAPDRVRSTLLSRDSLRNMQRPPTQGIFLRYVTPSSLSLPISSIPDVSVLVVGSFCCCCCCGRRRRVVVAAVVVVILPVLPRRPCVSQYMSVPFTPTPHYSMQDSGVCNRVGSPYMCLSLLIYEMYMIIFDRPPPNPAMSMYLMGAEHAKQVVTSNHGSTQWTKSAKQQVTQNFEHRG